MSDKLPFPRYQLAIEHLKGSGPGGQNRNKRMSGVRVTHLPTGISVLATERRSQNQNLQAALERLEAKVARHFFRPAVRHETRVPRREKEGRLNAKRVKTARKRQRRRVDSDDF